LDHRLTRVLLVQVSDEVLPEQTAELVLSCGGRDASSLGTGPLAVNVHVVARERLAQR